jgi:peptidoglycan/LPS O-acetylase OafA/YrhL
LNTRLIEWIGLLSYSLYLWQQLFLNRNSTAWVHAFPVNIILVVACASASYYALEKPLMRLRKRLRPKAAAAAVVQSVG